MFSDKLVVECNEDGFTEENLYAICDIGKSSKQGAQGFIGEKGIGFKSVFMAAYRVHVQSGVYSFAFEHRPNGSGIGMIRPIWQEPTEELPQHLTRMTLYLHDEGDEQHIARQRESIRQQLRELNGDVLLFMRNLQEIRITIDDGATQASTIFTKSHRIKNRITIEKTIEKGDKSETSSLEYIVIKKQVSNLAKNTNRTYSKQEEEQKAYSIADVVLAFPLSSDSVPIIEPQKLFAFLPVKHAGFSFLIQSDFLTNASREGIVVTAQRNIDLLDGICDTFLHALIKFCDHPTLQYTWMRYLPDKNKNTYDSFWSELVRKIEAGIRTTPLIRPDSGGPLQLITELGQPRPTYVDQKNNLLLRDLKPEVSLSRHYEADDVAILERYGLGDFKMSYFIMMVNQDLEFKDSWIKNRSSDDYLQTKVPTLLREALESAEDEFRRQAIRSLPIIPLKDGRWISGLGFTKAFFPSTKGVSIPRDLQFNLISPDAAARSESRELFKALGIESLSIDRVRTAIFSKHQHYRSEPGRLVNYYVEQLEFLFHTHRPGFHHKFNYNDLLVVLENIHQRTPSRADAYLPDDNPFGPKELLKPIESKDGAKEPGERPEIDFIHELYMKAPETPHQKGLDWYDWLVESIGIRRSLRLTNLDSTGLDLSKACYYVAKYRPEKFIALLHNRWPQGSEYFKDRSVLLQKLKDIPVLCQGSHMEALQNTYLPLPHLIEQVSEFIDHTNFPFLELGESSDEKFDDEAWNSLIRKLGIGNKDDLEFYLKILAILPNMNGEHDLVLDKAVMLYSKIYGLYLQSSILKERLKQTIQ
ncbi:hypothetical protein IL306_003314 [Fusarium sp. DS 682]|nr:hypothetical protein IL306_003314 [Fusarium sp. DS 682]